MKAILIVSFGTSHEDTRKKTIDKIEEDIKNTFYDTQVFSAWTSKIIINKLKKEADIDINDVSKAILKIIDCGIKDLLVVPTHIINGVENENMKRDVLKYSNHFSSIKFASPLLTYDEDYQNLVNIIAQDIYFDIKKISNLDFINDNETALVLMGHGSCHYSNTSYAALDYRFKENKYKNIYIACVEGYPYLDNILEQIKDNKIKNIILMPLMIVAGEHAKNDMSGNDDNSWKNILLNNSYNVQVILKGLAEYKSIRDIFIKRIKNLFDI